MNFEIKSLLNLKGSNLKKTTSRVIVTTKSSLKEAGVSFGDEIQEWQVADLERSHQTFITGTQGPIWFVNLSEDVVENEMILQESEYSRARNTLGSLVSQLLKYRSENVQVDFFGCSKELITGAIVGLETALYRFEDSLALGTLKFKKDGKALNSSIIENAKNIGRSINQARHLVNLPPNQLNPATYASSVKKMFSKSKVMKVKVIDHKELKKQKCGLLLSVGNSASTPPCIIHMQYRPKTAKGKLITLVGKGLTFDSGGLNMKSSAGMRLMKKDMGGSATLMGLASYLETSNIKKNIDIYLACAENAVSENASRPSDIITARNGLKVEIHNTDAEGRLAMADTIDLALEDKPALLIDVATLTGAGKVALGQDITSLFSNDDKAALKLMSSAQEMGDYAWRMPLYSKYFKALRSDFSYMANAASGHGGAITAALFLQQFVGKTKWIHLDIFGWTTANQPHLPQKGGNGQMVEALIKFLS